MFNLVRDLIHSFISFNHCFEVSLWLVTNATFVQIEAWKGNYIAAVETPAPEMVELAKWLESNVPEQATSSQHYTSEMSFYLCCSDLFLFNYYSIAFLAIVHGDYRLGNLVFDATEVSPSSVDLFET